MTRALLGLALALAAAAPAAAPPEAGWQEFEGSWSLTGRRQELPTEGARPAGVVVASGAVVMTRGDGLSRGFRGEVIAYDDGGSLAVGRCVFTDERGDRIYAALAGEAPGTGRHVNGTFTGGTGRYAAISGSFSFDWQIVLRLEDGTFEGRTTNLAGRFRRAPAEAP